MRVQVVIQAVMVPRIFFFAGNWMGRHKPKAIRRLNEYELASRLAFSFGAVYRISLVGFGGKGALRKQLESEVQRMLADSGRKRWWRILPVNGCGAQFGYRAT